jgi:hypothetical protein
MFNDIWSIITIIAIPLTILSFIANAIRARSNFIATKKSIISLWKMIPNWQELRVGLIFDYSGIIGGSRKADEELLISCIQLTASGSLGKITDEYIRSNITNTVVPLLCSTKKHGYLKIEEAKNTDIDDVIRLQACFYKPGIDRIEGKYFTEFQQEFGDFSVVLIMNKKEIEMKRYTSKQLIKHLNKCFIQT